MPFVFRAYSFLRRFNQLIEGVEPEILLAMDDEVRKIEALEAEDRAKMEKLKQKARE